MRKIHLTVAIVISTLFIFIAMSACSLKQYSCMLETKTQLHETSVPMSDVKKQPSEISEPIPMEEMNKENTTEKKYFNVSYCDMNLRTKIDLDEKYFNKKITSFESWLEISKILPGYIPAYDSDYFVNNSLIVCVGKSGSGGNKLRNVQLSFDKDIATVVINAESGILCVMTDWVLILEIDEHDLETVNSIVVKANF